MEEKFLAAAVRKPTPFVHKGSLPARDRIKIRTYKRKSIYSIPSILFCKSKRRSRLPGLPTVYIIHWQRAKEREKKKEKRRWVES